MPSIRNSDFQEKEICISQVIFSCVISTAEPREGSTFEQLLSLVGITEQQL
jgi:hypothetical protein